VLADLLEAAGVRLTGLVLQSPALNYNSNCGIIVAMVSCGGYLPSYGATGAWFNLSNPTPATAQFPAFIDEARTAILGQIALVDIQPRQMRVERLLFDAEVRALKRLARFKIAQRHRDAQSGFVGKGADQEHPGKRPGHQKQPKQRQTCRTDLGFL